MAGVASGLALATTLMAMQVADSMNARAPAYQIEISPIMPMQEHGYLGVVQTVDRTTHCMTVTQVNAGSPADHVGLQKDDIVLAIDGVAFRPANENEVVARFANETPGTMMTLTVERSHAILTLRPILAVRPSDKPFE